MSRNRKGFKIVLFVVAEILAQVGLLTLGWLVVPIPVQYSVILGMLIAIAFMGYFDSSRAQRLASLESDVIRNDRDTKSKISNLKQEIEQNKSAIRELNKRLESIERQQG